MLMAYDITNGGAEWTYVGDAEVVQRPFARSKFIRSFLGGKNLSLSQPFSKETMRQWNRPRRANRSNKQGVGNLIKNLRRC